MPALDFGMFFAQVFATEVAFVVLYLVSFEITEIMRIKLALHAAMVKYVNEQQVKLTVAAKYYFYSFK